jgi:hypothetical protein
MVAVLQFLRDVVLQLLRSHTRRALVETDTVLFQEVKTGATIQSIDHTQSVAFAGTVPGSRELGRFLTHTGLLL